MKLQRLWNIGFVGLVLFAIVTVAGLLSSPPAHAQGFYGRPINCVVAVSTATTVQAVGGDCVAQDRQMRVFITDVLFASSAASGTAADSFPTLKVGTGTTCGTNTAVVWGALSAANTTVWDDLGTPIVVPVGYDVCWIMTTGGSKFITIQGYLAP